MTSYLAFAVVVGLKAATSGVHDWQAMAAQPEMTQGYVLATDGHSPGGCRLGDPCPPATLDGIFLVDAASCTPGAQGDSSIPAGAGAG